MRLTVILPTVHPERVRACLENLTAAVPLERIIVADVPAPAECDALLTPADQWIVRARRGVVDAVNIGMAAATGDAIFLTNDETMVDAGCLDRLAEHAMTHPEVLWTPAHRPAFTFAYYGKPFAPFPCAHRMLIDGLGGLLDPAFHGFYADPDLSMRAHRAGVPVQVVPDAGIQHNNGTSAEKDAAWAQWFLADRATFRARWDHLGEFRDP